jgi:FkbM family methyltransferase
VGTIASGECPHAALVQGANSYLRKGAVMICDALRHPAAVSDVDLWRLAQLVGEAPARRGPMMFFCNDRGALTASLRAYGEWAENEIAFCGRFIQPGETVLDVGAYIGTHALAFAECVGPSGQVHSFEAQPASFVLLAHNLAACGLAQVSAVNAAVSHAMAGPSILLDEIEIDTSRSYGSAAIGGVPGRCAQVPVPVVALDALDLQSCALIKIDVEGMEEQVLRGAERLLTVCTPIVYAECNAVDAGARVASVLRAAGYEVWMHLVDAYNPHNWRANPVNIFGNSREAALVGVPPRHRGTIRSLRTGERENFFEIRTLDDMVAGMLLKPQYPREILNGTTAFRSVPQHV